MVEIMKKSFSFLLLFVALTLTGCGSSKMYLRTTEMNESDKHSIHTIAMMPGGGLLSEAIGIELFNRGYQVYDSDQMTNFIVRSNMINEFELIKPQNLRLLREEGIDAYLSVKFTTDYAGTPRNVSARLSSASTGKLLAGLTWENGWGCARGSGCDRKMHKSIPETAIEIAQGLASAIESNRKNDN